MASFVFHKTLAKILAAYLVSGADIRAALVMTNTTVDTETDVEFVSGFTTLDEMDGANYARETLTGEASNEDLGNDRAEFTVNALTFPALGNGTRQVEGVLIFKFVTNDADSVPIAFVDPTGWPLNPGGADLTVTPNAEGLLQLANA